MKGVDRLETPTADRGERTVDDGERDIPAEPVGSRESHGKRFVLGAEPAITEIFVEIAREHDRRAWTLSCERTDRLDNAADLDLTPKNVALFSPTLEVDDEEAPHVFAGLDGDVGLEDVSRDVVGVGIGREGRGRAAEAADKRKPRETGGVEIARERSRDLGQTDMLVTGAPSDGLDVFQIAELGIDLLQKQDISVHALDNGDERLVLLALRRAHALHVVGCNSNAFASVALDGADRRRDQEQDRRDEAASQQPSSVGRRSGSRGDCLLHAPVGCAMLILRKETVMPLIEVHLLEGRSPEQKRALLEGITRAVQDSIGASLESIRVWIHEFSNEEYMAGGVLAADKKKKEKA